MSTGYLSTQLKGIVDRRLASIGETVGRQVGAAQIVNIRQRVAKGVGMHDQKMPVYSDAYKRSKQASGRNVDVRDLTYTGRMLGAMVSEIAESNPKQTRVVIKFTDKPSQSKARYNQRRSAWFGISPRDRIALRAIQRRALKTALSRSKR